MKNLISQKNILIILCLIFIFSCKEKTLTNTSKKSYPNLVQDYEKEIKALDGATLTAIDSAVNIFQTYQSRAKDKHQIDSLFMPFFSFYNIGRRLLAGKEESLIQQYGFKQKIYKDQKFIIPAHSKFMKENILQYLSKPMQEFTAQQLGEFSDASNLQTRADNTIWWEQFNKNNPDFFLHEMAAAHYKFWHLNKLLTGTKNTKIVDEQGNLTEEADSVYVNVMEQFSDSKTASTLKQYIALLAKNREKETDELQEFLKQYDPKAN